MIELENQINCIIKKHTHYPKFHYEIDIVTQVPMNVEQFPNVDSKFKKIDIICKNQNIDSFIELNSEIKKIYEQIVKIDMIHFVSFIFEKCSIKFWNEDLNLDNNILLKECNININIQDTALNEIYLLKKNFYDCRFENLSLLSDVNTVCIDLDGLYIDLFQIVNLEIFDMEINKIEIRNSEINKIMIQNSIIKSEFTIYTSRINNIDIKNVDFETLFEFNEVRFEDNFDFQEITYKGLTLFDRCIFNTKAKFEYIIFEKFTSFRESIFNKGLNLDFTSCDNEINFFGIKGLNQKESKENTSQETYRILKHNFEKIGNKIDSNEYLTLELDKHRNNIWNSSEFSFRLLRDGIVSFLHWISSNHSSNWFLTLVWMFIVSIVTNVYFNNDLEIECLFKYINILSSIEDFNNSYFIMILNKVSLGYLYYQFLTAIRKDTRK